MQRIKRTRWPTKNPYGDNLFFKIRYTRGGTMTIPIGSSRVTASSLQMNSGADWVGVFADSPGVAALAAAFENYRIFGVKIKTLVWPVNQGVGAEPVVFFYEATPQPSTLQPATDNMPEQRWVRYRTVSFAQSGAKPTTVSAYYSVNKVYGPDAIVKNSINFTGGLQIASPYFLSPVDGPHIRWGLFTISSDAVTAATDFTIKQELTLYTKFFSKRQMTA